MGIPGQTPTQEDLNLNTLLNSCRSKITFIYTLEQLVGHHISLLSALGEGNKSQVRPRSAAG